MADDILLFGRFHRPSGSPWTCLYKSCPAGWPPRFSFSCLFVSLAYGVWWVPLTEELRYGSAVCSHFFDMVSKMIVQLFLPCIVSAFVKKDRLGLSIETRICASERHVFIHPEDCPWLLWYWSSRIVRVFYSWLRIAYPEIRLEGNQLFHFNIWIFSWRTAVYFCWPYLPLPLWTTSHCKFLSWNTEHSVMPPLHLGPIEATQSPLFISKPIHLLYSASLCDAFPRDSRHLNNVSRSCLKFPFFLWSNVVALVTHQLLHFQLSTEELPSDGLV